MNWKTALVQPLLINEGPQRDLRVLAWVAFVLGRTLRCAFDAAGKALDAPNTRRKSGMGRQHHFDGSAVVVAYADGTIRWHRMSDGFEILALQVLKGRWYQAKGRVFVLAVRLRRNMRRSQ